MANQLDRNFENLTWAPLERELIDPDLLTDQETAWVDDYHAQVLAKIGPLLKDDTLAWLQERCIAIR